MRFVVSDGRRFKDRLEDFPWKNLFQNAKILAVCVEKNDVVAACGIDELNYAGLYVKEQFRRRGIGGRLFKKAIIAAKKNGCSFLIGDVSPSNAPAFHLDFKLGFREIAYFKRSENMFIMLPLDIKGEFLFAYCRFVCYMLPNLVLEHIRSNRSFKGFIKTFLAIIP